MSAHRGSLSGPMHAGNLEQKLVIDGLRYAAGKAERRDDYKSAANLRFVATLVEGDLSELERGRQWLIAAERAIR